MVDTWAETWMKTTTHGQGGSIPSSKFGVRLVAMFWCLTAFVLGNAFKETLVSIHIVPRFNPTIDTLDQLAANQYLDIIVDKNSGIHQMILVDSVARHWPRGLD